MRVENLYAAFAGVEKPESAKGCSQGCCMEDDDVRALLDFDQRSLSAKQLMAYLDGAFVTLSNVREFTYLLPGMLRIWAEEVMKPSGAYTEYFHAALGQRYEEVAQLAPSFITTQLSPALQEAVIQFMHEVMLNRIGFEESLSIKGMSTTHYWFRVFAAYGALVPDLETLWQQWWAFPTPGHGVAAVQYASCLIFGRQGNPVFAPWDRNKGGGSPCLWDYDAFNDEGWLWFSDSREFLEKTLTVRYLEQKLTEVSGCISDSAPTVTLLQKALKEDPALVELRIGQLLQMLNTKNSQVRLEESLQNRL